VKSVPKGPAFWVLVLLGGCGRRRRLFYMPTRHPKGLDLIL
jgi:hypothetical protein